MEIYETQKKIDTIVSESEIIAIELVALNSHFYREIIHFIGTKYVNKESQDVRYTSDRVFRTDVLSE